MSTPTVTSSDLEMFLGMDTGTINAMRASAAIQDAQNLCESIAFPLPLSANVVVKIVAARGYINPQGVQSETVGPYHAEWGTSTGTGGGSIGPYLTRGDKATIRRLAGGSSAFSIETLPPGVNAVQLVTVTATGGTFLLSLTGSYTTPLAYNALSGDLQNALTALSLIGVGNVAVTGNGPYTVTFINHLATTPVPLMGTDGSLLTGPGAAVTVSTVTRGVYAPGQGLSPWDRDYLQGNQLGAGGGDELSGGGVYD
jgi:hypothetical protein